MAKKSKVMYEEKVLGSVVYSGGKTIEEIVTSCGVTLATTEDDWINSPDNEKYSLEDLAVINRIVYILIDDIDCEIYMDECLSEYYVFIGNKFKYSTFSLNKAKMYIFDEFMKV